MNQRSWRFMLVGMVMALVALVPRAATAELALVRDGVGIYGSPLSLSQKIDVNRNGRPELLVAGRSHISLVEEYEHGRGYREVARLIAPESSLFRGAMVLDGPGVDLALLLSWNNRLEIRDPVTLAVRAVLPGTYSGAMDFGDVNGDGLPELVTFSNATVSFHDPSTLALRGRVVLPAIAVSVGDILGDARVELLTVDGRAFSVTAGSSLAWSASEVWSAGVTGDWVPYFVELNGSPAVVLHNAWGHKVLIAKDFPSGSLRTLIDGQEVLSTPTFADVNNDGRIDMIFSIASKIRAVDLTSAATIWERDTIYQAPNLGSVAYPVAVDLDLDGAVELVWRGAQFNSGLVSMSAPPFGEPRWRSDNQNDVMDWSLLKRSDGRFSIAYLTYPTMQGPRLSQLGFIDGLRLLDEGGAVYSWLPGYLGLGDRELRQTALTTLRRSGVPDRILVAGTEYSYAESQVVSRWFWTFDEHGALLTSKTYASDITPRHVLAAQVLGRSAQQVVVLGEVPPTVPGVYVYPVRVDVIDVDSGAVLWQSALLNEPSSGMGLSVADMDMNGDLEIIVSEGSKISIFKPSSGMQAVTEHSGRYFSVLEPGVGQLPMLAVIQEGVGMKVFRGLSTTPEKLFEWPQMGGQFTLFSAGANGPIMIAEAGVDGVVLHDYDDGQVVASFPGYLSVLAISSVDIDGDGRPELVGTGQGFKVFRYQHGKVFRADFEPVLW